MSSYLLFVDPAYVPEAWQATGSITPAAPSFVNFSDTQTGGSVDVVAVSPLPLSRYVYALSTAPDAWLAVPSSGRIVVGNVTARLSVKSIAGVYLGLTYNESEPAISALFTSYSPPPAGAVTPAPPTFADFTDTPAGGSVRIVAAAGLALSQYVYAQPGSASFQAVPSDGVVSVANVSGSVRAKSVAGTYQNVTYAESEVASSPAFTTYSAPPPATTYDNLVTGGNSLKGVTLGADPADKLEFNNFAGETSNVSPLELQLYLAGTQVASVPFFAYYKDQACRYTHLGVAYTKTFTDGRVDL